MVVVVDVFLTDVVSSFRVVLSGVTGDGTGFASIGCVVCVAGVISFDCEVVCADTVGSVVVCISDVVVVASVDDW